jgi:hypothetical protein
MNESGYMGFADAIGEEGYGIVLDRHGNFCGIWTPSTLEDQPYPENLIKMCIAFFGVDPENNTTYRLTRH